MIACAFDNVFLVLLSCCSYYLLLSIFSLQYHTDPHTGKESRKKRLGGAYPGQRRPQHQPYTPPEEAFAGGNTATQHFVAHGGGNALTLAKPDGSAIPPASGGPTKEYIQGASFVQVYTIFCINFAYR